MDYCPEIAVIHGAFALVEKEKKSGRIDLDQHIKGDRSKSLFLLLKAAIREVSVQGLEKPLNQQERQYWGRHLHHIFFCKAFVFNAHFVSKEIDEEKLCGLLKRFKILCAPIPDFHPHFYFELADEFGWAEFLGEMLASVDLPTALDFVSCCLTFCLQEPALLYDLNIISTTLDFLVSVYLIELSCPPRTETDTTSLDEKKRKSFKRDSNGKVIKISVEKKEEILQNGAAEETYQHHPRAGGTLVGSQDLQEDGKRQIGHSDQNTSGKLQSPAGLVGRLDKAAESAEVLNEKNRSKTLNGKTGESADDLGEETGSKDMNKKMNENADNLKDMTESKDVENKTDLKVDDFNKETGGKDVKKNNQSVIEADELKQKAIVQSDEQLQDDLARLVTLTTEMLSLVQKRMSTKLFDRNTCKSGAMSNVLHILGHLLASTVVFSVISFSTTEGQELRDFFTRLMVKAEDQEDQVDLCTNESDTSTSKYVCESKDLTPDFRKGGLENHVSEFVCALVKDAQIRKACLHCLSSFFTAPSKTESTPQKLSLEKSVKFGRVLKLSLKLCLIAKPLKTLMVTQELVGLLAGCLEQEKNEMAVELTTCMSAILKELQRREKLAEQRRLNPSLEEVMVKIQKRLPRWKWCLQFGLAKRDLKSWWLLGFLELLHKDPMLLDKESDVKHLLSVLTEIANLTKHEPGNWVSSLKMCTELILRTFGQLSAADQENIILSTYTETAVSQALQCAHLENIDQSLTVTFNKLSASTTPKDLQAALRLALYSPKTFTHHAVLTAVNSRGQIPVIAKVLQLVPGVMKCTHPKHHPEMSLLCNCLRDVLTELNLNLTEQKNVLSLVPLLVQSYNTDEKQPPLLSPSEFLASCVSPFISTETAHRPISIEFALRLLISCLDATLSDKNSGWLEDIYPVVIVACCARILQDNMKFAGETDAENEAAVSMKSLVLCVLDSMQKHFYAAEKVFEGLDLSWLQEKCAKLDGMVSAYLFAFLSPTPKTLLAEFAVVAVRQAPKSPAALLQLSATSDAAAEQVMLALQQQQSQDFLIAETALLGALCQVFPNLLVSEVKRPMQVLSFLISTQLVEGSFKEVILDVSLPDDFTEWQIEMMISQILMDTAVLIVACHSHLTPTVLFHHIAQVLVVALQTLLQSVDHRNKQAASPWALFQHMFFHVCVIMSAAHDSMLEPLFVVLLDIVARLTQQASSSGLTLHTDFLTKGIQLIPTESLQEILVKKLENQMP